MKMRFLTMIALTGFIIGCNQQSQYQANQKKFNWKPSKAVDKPEKLHESYEFKATIPEADPNMQIFRMEASIKKRIELKSGTTIDIPANAFVNAKGKVVKGDVDIQYREMFTPSEVLASGIPMQMGDGHMRSGGMFQIQAEAQGEEVFLAQNKNIDVDFATFTDDNSYSNFFLRPDPTGDKWERLGASRIKENRGKKQRIKDIENQLVDERKFTIKWNLEDNPELAEMDGKSFEYCGSISNSQNPNHPDNKWVLEKEWDSFELYNILPPMVNSYSYPYSYQSNSPVLSPGGRFLVSGSGSKVNVVDLKKNKSYSLGEGAGEKQYYRTKLYGLNRDNSCIKFTKDEKYVAVKASKGIMVFSTDPYDKYFKKIEFNNYGSASLGEDWGFTEDDKAIFSVADKQYTRTNLFDSKKMVNPKIKNGHASADGKSIVELTYKTINVYDTYGKLVKTYPSTQPIRTWINKVKDIPVFSDDVNEDEIQEVKVEDNYGTKKWAISSDASKIALVDGDNVTWMRIDGFVLNESDFSENRVYNNKFWKGDLMFVRSTIDGMSLGNNPNTYRAYDMKGTKVAEFEALGRSEVAVSADEQRFLVSNPRYNGEEGVYNSKASFTIYDREGKSLMNIYSGTPSYSPKSAFFGLKSTEVFLKGQQGRLNMYIIDSTVVANEKRNLHLYGDAGAFGTRVYYGEELKDVQAYYAERQKRLKEEAMKRLASEADLQREFTVRQLGVYNVDKIEKMPEVASLKIRWQLEGSTSRVPGIVYQITGEDGQLVIKNNGKLNVLEVCPVWKNGFVAVLSNGEMAVLSNQEFHQAYLERTGREVVLDLKKIDYASDKDKLTDVMAKVVQ